MKKLRRALILFNSSFFRKKRNNREWHRRSCTLRSFRQLGVSAKFTPRLRSSIFKFFLKLRTIQLCCQHIDRSSHFWISTKKIINFKSILKNLLPSIRNHYLQYMLCHVIVRFIRFLRIFTLTIARFKKRRRGRVLIPNTLIFTPVYTHLKKLKKRPRIKSQRLYKANTYTPYPSMMKSPHLKHPK